MLKLVEKGSPLSHAIIAAREYGLPTIVGIDGLIQKLKPNDSIEMDAESGMIYKT